MTSFAAPVVSVASSRIEGLEIGARRLLRAEAERGLGDDPSDVTAVEVLGNIDASLVDADSTLLQRDDLVGAAEIEGVRLPWSDARRSLISAP
ncbi:MAG: hypothetical protein M0Z95_21625 [Actinomycetota bacterium]|nr:hypothetical protein [Actinomycetota bacterium]